MAKDPAILWYWSDWNSGTSTMTRFLKGCYIDLLHAQYNSGPLSIEEIKIVLGSDFGQAWPAIQKKFKCLNGLFSNERLELEKEKRKAFSESRRKNRNGTSVKDMNNTSGTCVEHMENVNENRDCIEGLGVTGGKGTFNHKPTYEDFKTPLPEVKAGSVVQMVRVMHQVDIDAEEVGTLWEAFKIQNLTGEKFYQSDEAVISHFINWAKNQRYGNRSKGVNGQPKVNSKSAGAVKMARSLAADLGITSRGRKTDTESEI